MRAHKMKPNGKLFLGPCGIRTPSPINGVPTQIGS